MRIFYGTLSDTLTSLRRADPSNYEMELKWVVRGETIHGGGRKHHTASISGMVDAWKNATREEKKSMERVSKSGNVYEKPTCVVNTGHHDAIIGNLTGFPDAQERFVANVQWYLHLMAEQCETILWIATTAPAGDGRFQKIKQTKEWNEGVKEMLSNDPILREMSVFIDVYDASLTYGHGDNGKLPKIRELSFDGERLTNLSYSNSVTWSIPGTKQLARCRTWNDLIVKAILDLYQVYLQYCNSGIRSMSNSLRRIRPTRLHRN
eukprot:scaffold8028_cov165-Amphora_coffeaeformis.AAC.7